MSIRPWGFFETLLKNKACHVKKITVNPKSRTSLQSHEHRDETWCVVKGKLTATIENEVKVLNVGETIFVPKCIQHRIENCEDSALELIEIQTGNSFEESDIKRFEDDYGRIK